MSSPPPLDPNEKLDIAKLLEGIADYRPRRKGWTGASRCPSRSCGPFEYHETIAEPARTACRCRRPTTSATSTRSPTAW